MLFRSTHTHTHHQTVELEAVKREVKERERKLSSQSEQLYRLEADKDRLEEEVRRLRKAESWARASPTLTPSTSSGDLSSVSVIYDSSEGGV